MKKVLVLVVVLVLALSVGAFAFQNEPEGFRGLKWGDPPTEDMVVTQKMKGDTIMYRLPDDKMCLGEATLVMVGYMFFQGRLSSAAMLFKGKENYNKIETIAKQQFGTEEVEKGFYRWTWISQNTSVSLSYDSIDNLGMLILSSVTIGTEQLEFVKKEAAEKAAEDW